MGINKLHLVPSESFSLPGIVAVGQGEERSALFSGFHDTPEAQLIRTPWWI
jgi:hypothetical protein